METRSTKRSNRGNKKINFDDIYDLNDDTDLLDFIEVENLHNFSNSSMQPHEKRKNPESIEEAFARILPLTPAASRSGFDASGFSPDSTQLSTALSRGRSDWLTRETSQDWKTIEEQLVPASPLISLSSSKEKPRSELPLNDCTKQSPSQVEEISQTDEEKRVLGIQSDLSAISPVGGDGGKHNPDAFVSKLKPPSPSHNFFSSSRVAGLDCSPIFDVGGVTPLSFPDEVPSPARFPSNQTQQQDGPDPCIESEAVCEQTGGGDEVGCDLAVSENRSINQRIHRFDDQSNDQSIDQSKVAILSEMDGNEERILPEEEKYCTSTVETEREEEAIRATCKEKSDDDSSTRTKEDFKAGVSETDDFEKAHLTIDFKNREGNAGSDSVENSNRDSKEEKEDEEEEEGKGKNDTKDEVDQNATPIVGDDFSEVPNVDRDELRTEGGVSGDCVGESDVVEAGEKVTVCVEHETFGEVPDERERIQTVDVVEAPGEEGEGVRQGAEVKEHKVNDAQSNAVKENVKATTVLDDGQDGGESPTCYVQRAVQPVEIQATLTGRSHQSESVAPAPLSTCKPPVSSTAGPSKPKVGKKKKSVSKEKDNSTSTSAGTSCLPSSQEVGGAGGTLSDFEARLEAALAAGDHAGFGGLGGASRMANSPLVKNSGGKFAKSAAEKHAEEQADLPPLGWATKM